MAQPTPYNITTDFSQDEASNLAGRSTLRTANLDAEFANIETTLDGICANLILLQRDDGALHDQIVTTDSLSANVKALISAAGVNPRGAWVTATAYAVKDVVETGAPLISYICVVAHTSGTFATDRAAGKWMVMGQEPGTGTFASLILTTGGITLGTNNTQDLAATGNRFRSGYFGTSVVAPLLQNTGSPLVIKTTDAVQVQIWVNNGAKWSFIGLAGSGLIEGDFAPIAGDNTLSIGGPTNRIKQLFTPIIDSGSTGALSLKLNNGETILDLLRPGAVIANRWTIQGGPAGSGGVSLFPTGGDANIAPTFTSRGSAGHIFQTDIAAPVVQFQILHTAGSNRNVTITGSNGASPTISTTAGALFLSGAGSAVGLTIGPGATSGFAINPGASPDISSPGSTVTFTLGAFGGVAVSLTGGAAQVSDRAVKLIAGASVSLTHGTVDVSAGVLQLSAGTSDIKWGKANVALGGGAAPTLGTIGGTGPAAAAQRNWLRFIESDGTPSFIPVWR